jgi:Phage tail tube protein
MATLATTSRTSYSYIPEATFGVIPVSGTVYALRALSDSLKYDITKERSKEINAYRSASSMIPTTAKVAGSISAEMQYAEYDRFIAAALQSSFSAYGTNGVGTTFTSAFTATTITATAAPTGSSAFTTLKKGQWFRIVAPADSNNGLVLRVSKTVAPTSTVITLDANTPAVVSASVAGCYVQSSRLTNGTTLASFAVERVQSDAGTYTAYRGQTPDKLDIQMAAGATTSLKLDFMGAGQTYSASATTLPSAPTASNSYDIQSGVAGSSCLIIENGVPRTDIKSLNFTYGNSLREQQTVCSLEPVGVGNGNITCEVSLDMYYSSGSVYTRFLSNTNTELCFSTMDAAGNGYVVTLPNAVIKSFDAAAGGENQDFMAKVVFSALRDASNADSTLRQLIFIDRFGAAVLP